MTHPAPGGYTHSDIERPHAIPEEQPSAIHGPNEVLMLRAPPVLLLLLALFGLGIPNALHAQDPDERAPVVPSKGYRLEQNYPNPPNPYTYIPFTL